MPYKSGLRNVENLAADEANPDDFTGLDHSFLIIKACFFEMESDFGDKWLAQFVEHYCTDHGLGKVY